jgi:inorganic pyrophosphatase
VIGGLQMIDAGQADDKIIAVLRKDPLWDEIEEISELPVALVNRLRHYFLTYKMYPGSTSNVHIEMTYPRAHALKAIQASLDDYAEKFGAD